MNEPDSVLSADDVNRIVTHMNEEHTEDLIRYAQAYADLAEVEAVRMTGIDAEGFDLDVRSGGTTTPARIDFDTPLDTVEDARARLVELAMAAREEAER
jgi:putative heme iron utilization protein